MVEPHPGELRLAYLTSQYPATSHTFISREVAALRELGLNLSTFSIRPPSASEMQDEANRAAADSTFTVLRRPAAEFLRSHLVTLASRPAGYFRTLGLALRHRPPGMRGLALSLAHFAEAIVLAGELKRRRITHLHNHFANSAATVGYLATRLLGVPWSFTMHGISETDYPAGLLLGRKIEVADFVVCVSYFGRAQAMRLVGADQWRKLHVVRCGLPMETLPRQARVTSRIICVGRLSPEKGQAGLLEAFAALASDHPQLELVLVGDGPQAAELETMTRSLQLGDRVHFAGRLGEAETLAEIARSDILVLPSFMEGLPIVLMEAMAMGTAVIASRVAGIPELIEDEVNGLLFTPSKWEELVECMKHLVDDRALHDGLIRSAQSTVAVEFDIRRSADKLRQLFEGGVAS